MRACEAPLVRGPLKGLPTTGTVAGDNRHRRAGEPLCVPCLEAKNAKNRRRYAANPEKDMDKTRRWRAANPEKRREQDRRWGAANPEKVREWNRQWNAANPEKRRDATRRWRAANPELSREQCRRRRSLKAKALTIPFTADQLAHRMAFWGNACWLCRGEYQEVDHVIPISLGGPHILANLRPACRSCNASKGARKVA